jgi:hypothetical protein
LRRADRAGLEQPPRGLQPRPEERVGRAADPQAGGIGLLDQGRGRREIGGDRLLVEDVLAGGERGRGDFGVRGRDGEVDDQLDVVASERLLEGPVAGDAWRPACARASSGRRSATKRTSRSGYPAMFGRYWSLIVPAPMTATPMGPAPLTARPGRPRTRARRRGPRRSPA